jgi:hypothetical protein
MKNKIQHPQVIHDFCSLVLVPPFHQSIEMVIPFPFLFFFFFFFFFFSLSILSFLFSRSSTLTNPLYAVSGIYFEPVEGKAMLLDAGEGTYGMLYRRFGESLNKVEED